MANRCFRLRRTGVGVGVFMLFCILGFTLNVWSYGFAKDLSLEVMSLSKDSSSSFEFEAVSSNETLHIDWPVSESDLVAGSEVGLSSGSASNLLSVSESGSPVLVADKKLVALRTLSEGYPLVVLSLIKDDQVSDALYFDYYAKLNVFLKESGISNIQFLLYPTSKECFDLCMAEGTSESVWGIGVRIQKESDIDWLRTVYQWVGGKKPVRVSDDIKDFYNFDMRTGIQTVYKLYYTLAMDYPDIQAVSVSHPKSSAVTLYTHAYNFVKNIRGTYKPALEYQKFSSEQYLVLHDPDEHFLSGTSYVQYKWNDAELIERSYYPYPLEVDTRALPNGINRLKIIGFDVDNKVLWRKEIDVEISNPLKLARSPRISSVLVDKKTGFKGKYVPVLMYHSFVDKLTGESRNSTVTTALFEEQLKALLKNGYTPITFYDLHKFLEGKGSLPQKPVILTADDGYLNNYTHAFPLLKKYQVPATFFISTAFVGQETVNTHFGWEEALEMEKSGLIDIQIHGYDHIRLTELSVEDIKYQISLSLGLIEKYLGPRDVVVVAYPEFKYTPATQKLLTDLSVDLQVTNLAVPGTVLQSSSIKRINVPDTMSAAALISRLEYLTY
jgi:peptidoglycan/xylan/chitin deacetylase (PgdA/CDA1 family)